MMVLMSYSAPTLQLLPKPHHLPSVLPSSDTTIELALSVSFPLPSFSVFPLSSFLLPLFFPSFLVKKNIKDKYI